MRREEFMVLDQNRLMTGHRAYFMIISTNATRTATVVTDTAGIVTVR